MIGASVGKVMAWVALVGIALVLLGFAVGVLRAILRATSGRPVVRVALLVGYVAALIVLGIASRAAP